MLNRYARAFFTRVLTPLARLLLRIGVSPDTVTVVGTLGVAVSALVFYPVGRLVAGTVAITLFIFSDLIDGTMARLSGRSSSWGAFLDSTLDRVGDAAIFGGLAIWFAGSGHDRLLMVLTLYCLVTGVLVSYARARAEGLGMTANVGIVERGERLVIVLTATGLSGLGLPYVEAIALWALAAGSTVTFFQRVWTVRSQALAAQGGADRPHPVPSAERPPGGEPSAADRPGASSIPGVVVPRLRELRRRRFSSRERQGRRPRARRVRSS